MSEQFILKNILDDTYYTGNNSFTTNVEKARIFTQKSTAETAIIMDDIFHNIKDTSRLKVINLRKIKLDNLKNI